MKLNEKALCSACNKVLLCGKSDLIKHSKTKSHIKNMTNRNITPSASLHKDHVKKVKTAEIQIAVFYAEHNIAFQIVDHMIPLLKKTCSNPQVVNDLKLSRKKCARIIKNVLGKRETEKLIINLKSQKFSILIDESTTICNDKLLCDNASVMRGARDSFATRLKEMPDACENVLHAVTYFSISAKRSTILCEFQNFFGVESRKVLKLLGTRWRLLDNWEVLKIQNKNNSAIIIFKTLNNNKIRERERERERAYMLFLKYTLKSFNEFNALFQGRQILIHKLAETSEHLIKQMGKDYFSKKKLNNESFFPNLENLVNAVLSLPHSNAEAKRIFSIVTDVKNKKRNRIDVTSLDAVCKVRSSFQAHNVDCRTFQVDSTHLELYSYNYKNLVSPNSDTNQYKEQ
ncbi:hypothetical protein ALC57_18591 [Trachymyrmex cornetzi]|uniref:HAT C-terminal dimerisation domain-containing protein n=1 Tax=Trachymyrmex cornetzi TaxID=471704 RepID=A0A151IRE9_9HYME|nr:hypothetical protein ALC57_18591 [Trachymyrmex cornetzi]